MPTAASHVWRPSRARRVVLDGFVPVPRGVVPAPPAPLVWPTKDPADILDYELDIAAIMAGNRGDAIATIDVAVTPNATGDLTMTAAAADGATVVLWFAGGIAGTTYAVQVTVTTANGRKVSRGMLLPVSAMSVAIAGFAPLLSSDGTPITDQNGNPILLGS